MRYLILLFFITGCTTVYPNNRYTQLPEAYNQFEWSGIYKVYNTNLNFVGTCFQINNNTLVTAAHVVNSNDLSYVVTLDFIPVTIEYIDEETDVAILKTTRNLYGQSYNIQLSSHLGETIRCFSYTDTGRIVINGIINCDNFYGYIGYSGGIRPGMSGSPVFNNDDEVIGLVSKVSSEVWSEEDLINNHYEANPTLGLLVRPNFIQEAIDAIR